MTNTGTINAPIPYPDGDTNKERIAMWKRITVALVLLALTLSACAARSANREPTYPGVVEMPLAKTAGGVEAPSYAEEAAPAPMGLPETGGGDFAADAAAPSIERLVIKNADLQLVVEDPPAVMKAIGQMAESMGGYVVNANLYQTTLESGVKVPQASITVRVPAEKLNEALEQIKAHSDQLPLREDISSQDVTSEYTDLNSRLRNLEAAETQLQKIMEEAYKTEDVLRVYQQLTDVRQQIEVIKGRMQYLEQSSALSAISVELIADAAVQPISIGGWEPSGVAKDAVRALLKTYQNLVDVLIWLVLYAIPVGVVVLLPVYLIVRGIIRWRRKRKAAKVTPES